jgi:C-terminal processing protease CtpA/Prc
MPGYGNEDVQPGDQLVQVDGHECELISLEDIRALVQGERGSLVELTLARSGSIEPNHYKILVKRHGRYEYETHTSMRGTATNVALDVQQQDGAFESL